MAKSLRSKPKLRAKSIKRKAEFSQFVNDRDLRLSEKIQANLEKQKLKKEQEQQEAKEAGAEQEENKAEDAMEGQEESKPEKINLKEISTAGGKRNSRTARARGKKAKKGKHSVLKF